MDAGAKTIKLQTMKSKLSKLITISISFFLLSFNGDAQTLLSGIVDADLVLEKINSPFQVMGNLIVLEDVELTIEPGVIVEFTSGTAIVLRGKMTAIGNEADSISFYSSLDNPSANDWDGIYVDNSYGASVKASYFNGMHANILFEVTSNSSDTLLHLTNSKFAQNQFVISEDDIVKNHIVYIENCLFSHNHYANDGASNNIILNSTFSFNAKGLYNSTCQATIIDNCVFHGNTERGIAVNGIVTNSSFYDNDIAILMVHCDNSIYENNEIIDNRIGINAYTTVGSDAPGIVQNNKICNNWEWNVLKTFGGDIDLTQNCWCLASNEDIAETVYDIFDDSELGFVIFEPFVEGDSCNLLTTINDLKLQKQSIEVFPNPTDGNLQININSNTSTTFQIELFDYSGKLIFNSTSIMEKEPISVDISHLKTGFYFLIVKNNNDIFSEKIIKF